MSRKRSRVRRYFQFLKRHWFAPALATMVLSLGGCGSRPAVNSSAQPATTPVPATPSSPTPSTLGDGLWQDWAPQLLPTELQLAPEFRFSCAPFTALPPSLMLDESSDVADVLEPMAACLTLGPLTGQQVHLVGSTDLPGRWSAPVHGSGRADQLRSSLSLLGVPFQNVVTYDVDNGKDIEVGVAPGSS